MLIFIIIIILYILLFKRKIENYDSLIQNVSFDTCGDVCKLIAGCYGFGYNKKTKVCLPTKEPIFRKPIRAIFKDYYSDENIYCNKVEPILEPIKTPGFTARRSNAMYSCTEKEDVHPRIYFHNQNRMIEVDEGVNFDFIPVVDNYEVVPYNWPVNKYDIDHLDVLKDKIEQDTITGKYLTETNRLRCNC